MKKIFRKARRLVNILRKRDVYFPVTLKKDVVRHGSAYGGWNILPMPSSESPIVYGFGIGKDLSFDLSIAAAYPNAEVHSFDPTPASIAWAAEQSLPAQISLHQYGLADRDALVNMAPPQMDGWVSRSIIKEGGSGVGLVEVPVKRLLTVCAELEHQAVDICKMDIEGAEYDVINDILSSDVSIKQLLVEFHHGMYGIDASRTRRAISQLLDKGFQVFSVSDTGHEYSFVSGGFQ